MIEYGPRDAASILMRRGHRVAVRWGAGRTWWVLDGRPVKLPELEDAAEAYEPMV